MSEFFFRAGRLSTRRAECTCRTILLHTPGADLSRLSVLEAHWSKFHCRTCIPRQRVAMSPVFIFEVYSSAPWLWFLTSSWSFCSDLFSSPDTFQLSASRGGCHQVNWTPPELRLNYWSCWIHLLQTCYRLSGEYLKADSQCQKRSNLLHDQSPRQLSIHNVHVLATSRPPRPWYLHDVAGRKSPSTERKWVPARQLCVLEPASFPPSLRASQGKRLWCGLCFQDYRFAFSAKDWLYCQTLKQIYLRKPPWQASALCNPKIITIFFINAKWQCRPEERTTWYGEHVVPAKIMPYLSMETGPVTQSLVAEVEPCSTFAFWSRQPPATALWHVAGLSLVAVFLYCESALRRRPPHVIFLWQW